MLYIQIVITSTILTICCVMSMVLNHLHPEFISFKVESEATVNLSTKNIYINIYVEEYIRPHYLNKFLCHYPTEIFYLFPYVGSYIGFHVNFL